MFGCCTKAKAKKVTHLNKVKIAPTDLTPKNQTAPGTQQLLTNYAGEESLPVQGGGTADSNFNPHNEYGVISPVPGQEKTKVVDNKDAQTTMTVSQLNNRSMSQVQIHESPNEKQTLNEYNGPPQV